MHFTITRYKSKSCVRTLLLYSHFSVTQWGLHSNHVKKIKFKTLRVSQESIHSGQNMTIKFLNHKFYTKSHTGNNFSTQNQFWKRPEWISTKIKLQLQGCYRVLWPFHCIHCTLTFSEASWQQVRLQLRREWHHFSNGPSATSRLNTHPWSSSFTRTVQAGPSIHWGSI